MRSVRTLIAASLLALAASAAHAAEPPRTMELEILANGRLVLGGQLIDGIDELEARLRVMRDQEPPFELSLRLPKCFTFETLAAIAQVVQRMGMSIVDVLRDGAAPSSAPIGHEGETI